MLLDAFLFLCVGSTEPAAEKNLGTTGSKAMLEGAEVVS